MGPSLVGDVYLGEAARRGSIHRFDDLTHMVSDQTPSPLAQHHNGCLATCQVLLIDEVLVRCDQHFESRGLGFLQ